MLVELDIDGPAAEEDFAERFFAPGDEKPQLRATALSLELASIWRSTYGNRFRLYKERKDKGKTREKRIGTESSIYRNQAKAAESYLPSIVKAGVTRKSDSAWCVEGAFAKASAIGGQPAKTMRTWSACLLQLPKQKLRR